MTCPVHRLFPRAPQVLALAAILILGAVYVAQYGFGLRPCELCLLERIPYFTILGLASAAMMPSARPWRRFLIAVMGVVFAASAVLAFYHVGVEHHWWAGTAECGAPLGQSAQSLDALRAQILATPIVRCDQVAWSLFGISMAGYNVLLSLGLAGFSFASLRSCGRQS